MAINASTNEKLKLPQELTKEELQELYKKYGITENDIKFAKGELPHYLEGTILDGSKKVIVTKDGKLPEDLINRMEENGINYDVVISHKEMFTIMEKARKEYIKKYGVDPANPKVDIVNGVPLPKDYVKELVKSGELRLENSEETKSSILSMGCGCSRL